MTTPPEPRTAAGRQLLVHEQTHGSLDGCIDLAHRDGEPHVTRRSLIHAIEEQSADAARSTTLAEVEKAVGELAGPDLSRVPSSDPAYRNGVQYGATVAAKHYESAVLQVIQALREGRDG